MIDCLVVVVVPVAVTQGGSTCYCCCCCCSFEVLRETAVAVAVENEPKDTTTTSTVAAMIDFVVAVGYVLEVPSRQSAGVAAVVTERKTKHTKKKGEEESSLEDWVCSVLVGPVLGEADTTTTTKATKTPCRRWWNKSQASLSLCPEIFLSLCSNPSPSHE